MKGKLPAALLIIGFLVLLLPAVKGATERPTPVNAPSPVTTAPVKAPVPAPKPRPQQKAIIDVAFCLDTTGSMSGLIEGAKQKIWGIVNTVAAAQPKPELRIALVAYRDQGDAYVTRKFEFTSDLETMYTQLRALSADGGGDTPEHVNRALSDAVNGLQWSQDAGALKIVYLVGDAPPHMDYQDGYDYHRIMRDASSRGIIVNTVQCGGIEETRQVWQEIARLADGKYTAIDQTGGMVAVASPYDEELARLSRDLNSTYVAYGDEGGRMAATQAENDSDAETRAPAAAAERAASKAGGLYRNERWDLVDADKSGSVKLEAMKPAELPEDLRGKTVEEQRAYLDQKGKDRDQIQKKIFDLSKKREDYVQNELKKSGSKSSSAFDEKVRSMLKEQAKDKGIKFE